MLTIVPLKLDTIAASGSMASGQLLLLLPWRRGQQLTAWTCCGSPAAIGTALAAVWQLHSRVSSGCLPHCLPPLPAPHMRRHRC